MKQPYFFLDDFSCCLGDLTRKQQRDWALVLSLLVRDGRFSIFTVTDNQVIARTVEGLVKGEYCKTCIKTTTYPWTNVSVTEKGQKFLEDNGYFISQGAR